uniref:FGFR1 oncogene partner (FOP) N-terminal dimerisation domain-containing protein n=1 Tax=Mola mola TaxID=94237 RepID=A0A3Q4AXQ3_MOLML
MATIAELKSAVKETLESRGVLSQLKARIRAEVFSALEDQREPRPPLSHENLLLNELIREYLEFNKYRYAASVLTAGGPRQATNLSSVIAAKFTCRSVEPFRDYFVSDNWSVLAQVFRQSRIVST